MFLKNKNISSKIKRSKVTDYAALNSNTAEIRFKSNHNVIESNIRALVLLNLLKLVAKKR